MRRELCAAGGGTSAAGVFDRAKPVRVSRAPGRLDVMGGIADYTGSLVCEAPLDRAVALAMQPRADRMLHILSFNLLDDDQPFTFAISLDALASTTAQQLRRELAEPGRRWGGYLAGCYFLLHETGLIDLARTDLRGANIALYSTVPLGAGVSSSAAIEVAMMMNLIDHFDLRHALGDAAVGQMRIAEMCQAVENRIVGAPCGIMDQVTACASHAGTLLRLVCQPHELQAALDMPPGIRAIGINSCVKHSVGGGMYGRTRCAAFMGHAIILDRMRRDSKSAGGAGSLDPMKGYLANLNGEDYSSLYRPHLPEEMSGREFIDRYGSTIDKATVVDPELTYHVRPATDHHVFEAQRVKDFVSFLEQASRANIAPREKGALLREAGQRMYGSHRSYTDCARLGAPECDLLVELVRQHEEAGLYGAKITGGGSGGTVAVLCDQTRAADDAIHDIMAEYETRTGRTPQALWGTSSGAWGVGTAVTEL